MASTRTSWFPLLLMASGCALYSEVYVQPLSIAPSDIRRGSNLEKMVDIGDYARAANLAPTIDAKPNPHAEELLLLGNAELACGRTDKARAHLLKAWEKDSARAGEIAWALSQTEYLANDIAESSRWAEVAYRNGVRIFQWHRDFLKALSSMDVSNMPSPRVVTVPIVYGDPEIPRIEVAVNGVRSSAVIDSGAVLSIISVEMAQRVGARPLGDFKGTFYGLLGEPISVSFATIDALEIDGLRIENVPVAIMPDRKMNFMIVNREQMKLDFLMGASLLKHFRLHFRFKEKRLTLTPLVLDPQEPDEEQNLFFLNFRPAVHAAINRNGWYVFLLDTGSEVTFLNDLLVPSARIRNAPRIHNAMLQGLGGAQKRGAKIESVEIGVDRWAGLFRTIPLYTGDAKDTTMGIIGENFLEKFAVTIDFGSMRMSLERE